MATTNLGLVTQSSTDYVSVDPFNTNWKAIDKLGVSYVTSEYNTGSWHVRVWSNGYKEQWGTVTFDSHSGTDDFHKTVAYGLKFSSKPVVNVNCAVSGMKDSYVKYVDPGTASAEVYVAKPYEDNVGCTVYVHAAGK